MTASMTLMNATGDFTLEWDESKAANMERWIQKKMNQGFSFFVVERKLLGLVKSKKAVTKVSDLKDRSVKISDDDMQRLAGGDKELFEILSGGDVDAVQNPDKGQPVRTVRRAKSAKEVAGNHTVAVQPIAGG